MDGSGVRLVLASKRALRDMMGNRKNLGDISFGNKLMYSCDIKRENKPAMTARRSRTGHGVGRNLKPPGENVLWKPLLVSNFDLKNRGNRSEN